MIISDIEKNLNIVLKNLNKDSKNVTLEEFNKILKEFFTNINNEMKNFFILNNEEKIKYNDFYNNIVYFGSVINTYTEIFINNYIREKKYELIKEEEFFQKFEYISNYIKWYKKFSNVYIENNIPLLHYENIKNSLDNDCFAILKKYISNENLIYEEIDKQYEIIINSNRNDIISYLKINPIHLIKDINGISLKDKIDIFEEINNYYGNNYFSFICRNIPSVISLSKNLEDVNNNVYKEKLHNLIKESELCSLYEKNKKTNFHILNVPIEEDNKELFKFDFKFFNYLLNVNTDHILKQEVKSEIFNNIMSSSIKAHFFDILLLLKNDIMELNIYESFSLSVSLFHSNYSSTHNAIKQFNQMDNEYLSDILKEKQILFILMYFLKSPKNKNDKINDDKVEFLLNTLLKINLYKKNDKKYNGMIQEFLKFLIDNKKTDSNTILLDNILNEKKESNKSILYQYKYEIVSLLKGENSKNAIEKINFLINNTNQILKNAKVYHNNKELFKLLKSEKILNKYEIDKESIEYIYYKYKNNTLHNILNVFSFKNLISKLTINNKKTMKLLEVEKVEINKNNEILNNYSFVDNNYSEVLKKIEFFNDDKMKQSIDYINKTQYNIITNEELKQFLSDKEVEEIKNIIKSINVVLDKNKTLYEISSTEEKKDIINEINVVIKFYVDKLENVMKNLKTQLKDKINISYIELGVNKIKL